LFGDFREVCAHKAFCGCSTSRQDRLSVDLTITGGGFFCHRIHAMRRSNQSGSIGRDHSALDGSPRFH
jgi:hypothetical protein